MKSRKKHLGTGCIRIIVVIILLPWIVLPFKVTAQQGPEEVGTLPIPMRSASEPCLQLSPDKGDEAKWEYWEGKEQKQVILVTLKVDPETVEVEEFKATWIVDSVKIPAKVINDIVYLPPLKVSFLFDLDSTAITPKDANEVDRDATFWYNLLWEHIIPAFNFDGKPGSDTGFVYISNGDAKPEFLGREQAAEKIFEYMKDALQRSQAVTTTRQPVGESLKGRTMAQRVKNSGVPLVWVIFRWRSIEDPSTIKDDYALSELNENGARAFILVVGRPGTPPPPKARWQYYERELAKRYKAMLTYIFVSSKSSDIGGQLEQFKQEVKHTHVKVRIPIQIPKLLSASQAETAKLVIWYDKYAECRVEAEWTDLAPLGDNPDPLWLWNLLFVFLPVISSLAFISSGVFLLGLWLYGHDLFEVRDEIE